MNHACAPNCAQSFRGKTLTVRCLRDVRAEEELTIAYVELAVTRAERRAQLMKQYLFDIDDEDGAAEKASKHFSTRVLNANATAVSVGSSATLHDHVARFLTRRPRGAWTSGT